MGYQVVVYVCNVRGGGVSEQGSGQMFGRRLVDERVEGASYFVADYEG